MILLNCIDLNFIELNNIELVIRFVKKPKSRINDCKYGTYKNQCLKHKKKQLFNFSMLLQQKNLYVYHCSDIRFNTRVRVVIMNDCINKTYDLNINT